MTKRRRAILISAGVFTALALGVFYRYADPMAAWMPKCPVYTLTGYLCPGCGTQRALHSLFTGDVAGAWRYNAALLCALPLLAVIGYAEMFRGKHPRLYTATHSSGVCMVIIAAFMLWMLIRNL